MHPHEALIGGSLKWGHQDVQIPDFAPAGFIAFVDAQRLLPILLPPPNSDESKKFSSFVQTKCRCIPSIPTWVSAGADEHHDHHSLKTYHMCTDWAFCVQCPT
jgi:hypothetical protein